MGNKSDSTADNSLIFNSNIKHPKLSNAKFVQHKNQMPYLEISQVVQCREVYDRWKAGISKYTPQGNQIQTILLPQQIQFQEKGICGSAGVIVTRYPVLPYVLSEEIINRAGIKQPFLEQELWYLLYTINMAGMTAHSRGTVLGDVRPENIMMSQGGEICVCCLNSFLEDEKNYYKALTLKLKTYLAPEQIKDLQKGKDSCAENQPISQCFSIGMTILAAILLKDQSFLYEIDYTFDEQSFFQQLNELKNKQEYSKLVRQITERMLAIDFRDRLTCREIITLLKPYETSIIDLKQFEINVEKIPSELQQRVFGSTGRNSVRRSKQNEYLKVINNSDFNKNSRVKYVQSPRNSNTVINQGQLIRSPSQNVITKLSNGQSQILNSPIIYRHEIPLQMSGSQAMFGPLQQKPMQYSMNYPAKSAEPLLNRADKEKISNSEQYMPHSHMISNSTINEKKSPSLINYGSAISSFIPDQYQQVMNFKKVQQPKTEINKGNAPLSKLAQSNINLQSTSHLKTSALQHDNKVRDKQFDTYEQVIKNFNEKLRLSRKSFPDDI